MPAINVHAADPIWWENRAIGTARRAFAGARAAIWLSCRFMIQAAYVVLYGIPISGARWQPADTLVGLGPAPIRLTRSGAAPEAHAGHSIPAPPHLS